MHTAHIPGAGLGLFLTYATYMRRTQGAVKLGTVTPFFNNVVRSIPFSCDVCLKIVTLLNSPKIELSTKATPHRTCVSPPSLPPPLPPSSSLLCGILVFCTVFSVETEKHLTKDQILGLLRENGPANTGLTFIWLDHVTFM